MAFKAALKMGVVSLTLAFLVSCRLQEEEAIDSPTDPEFLTPVAAAQAAGITPYWMGESFPAGSLTFELNAKAEFFRDEGDPELVIKYGADLDEGAVGFDLDSLSKESAQGRMEKAVRTASLFTRPGEEAAPKQVSVGPWEGQILPVPGGARPVNALLLFVEVDGGVALARASSGGTGVPGTDVNPLLDEELLISVVAENLRRYPD